MVVPSWEGLRRQLGRTPPGRAVRAAQLARAERHRGSLASTRFIAVTGSSGKTTAKELIAAVLSTRLGGTKNPGTKNMLEAAAAIVRETSPADDFSVLEIDAWRPGSLAEAVPIVRPTLAVVTTVGPEHQREFGSVEAVVSEIRILVEAAAEGAVLNADDPLVSPLRGAARGPVDTFGLSEGATFRATDVAGAWPDPLRFTLSHRGRSLPVVTGLYGRHWTPSVLAAVAVAVRVGIPLEAAVRAVQAFQPVSGRLSPVTCDGVVFVRDVWKSPRWSVGLALDFMAEARAERKIVVLGRVTNYREPAAEMYGKLAERALAVADEVVLVGPDASQAVLSHDEARVRRFGIVRDAARHFETALREGDLVLLKGELDHLERIPLVRQTTVRCWRERCGRRLFCDACYLRRLPARPGKSRLPEGRLSP